MYQVHEVKRTKSTVRYEVQLKQGGTVGEAGLDKAGKGWGWWTTVWDDKQHKDITHEGTAPSESDAADRVFAILGGKPPSPVAKREAVKKSTGKKCSVRYCPKCGHKV